MLKGSEHVEQARQMLCRRDLPPKERLRAGGRRIWSAYYHYDSWPRWLQNLADGVLPRILAGGPIDVSVASMDDATAEETIDVLLRFVTAFQAQCEDAPPEEASARPSNRRSALTS